MEAFRHGADCFTKVARSLTQAKIASKVSLNPCNDIGTAYSYVSAKEQELMSYTAALST